MKFILAVTVVLASGLAAIWLGLGGKGGTSGVNASGADEPTTRSNAKHSMLVELFTSEGCSSCPPADRLLTSFKNERSGDVITLSYHVDYWNYLGWKDKFSSAEFTKRQESYARQFKLSSTYTPQMVVNGSAEFVGSNRGKASEVIGNAVSDTLGTIDLSLDGGKLTADIQGLPGRSEATVYLAVAESGLFTKVGGGENSGSTLEHSSVVRQLTSIGKVRRGETVFNTAVDLPKNSEWRTENVQYVVFVQDTANLKVLAAAATK